MPNQNYCNWLNDKISLNKCMREGRIAHAQQHFAAIERMDDRRERLEARMLRQAAQLRALSAVLVGACVMALAVLIMVALGGVGA